MKGFSEITDARMQVRQVSVYETETTHGFEYQMQAQPEILSVCRFFLFKLKQGLEFERETLEQFQRDVILVAKVVVEISWTDVGLVGDMVSADIGFAVFVEQAQAGAKNQLPGVAPRHSGCGTVFVHLAAQFFNQVDVLLHGLLNRHAAEFFPGLVLGDTHEIKKPGFLS